ncbi:MAG: hypothetical protein QNI99_02545 [Woeseiaceae bacterium]|nr:hypothetical protein [Woeseiaceae bacterium]
MIRILANILLATAPALASAETLGSDLFELELPTGWALEAHSVEPPASDEVFELLYKKGEAAATISTMLISHPDREALANAYLDIRLQAEEEVNAEFGETVTYEEAFENKGYGHQIEYFGSDSSGRLFRYWGFIRDTKLINIYIETYDMPEESLETLFRELLSGLSF